MAFKLAPFIKESTTTTGTGTLSLGGIVLGGRQTFVEGIGSGNTTDYYIYEVDYNGLPTGAWESGTGTVTSGSPDTLSRNTVHSSSNSDSLVNFSSGTKHVSCFPHTSKLEDPSQVGHTHAASDITSGSFADARISQSSVTQHQSAIDHNSLSNFSAAQHRTINDSATGVSDLWSADKISTELGGKANTGHTHTLSGITDSGAAAAKGVTGLDANAVTGTAGTSGNITQWNADGDLVGTGFAASVLARTDQANTFNGQQTVVGDSTSQFAVQNGSNQNLIEADTINGKFVVRHPGGTAGMDEVHISDDGTHGLIESNNSWLELKSGDKVISLNRAGSIGITGRIASLDNDDIGVNTSRFTNLFLQGTLDVDLNSDTQAAIFKANSSQTNNLTEWQDSAGNVLSAVDSSGHLQVNGASGSDLVNIKQTGNFTQGVNIIGDTGINPQFRVTSDNGNGKLQVLSRGEVLFGSNSNTDFGLITDNTKRIHVRADGQVRVGQGTVLNAQFGVHPDSDKAAEVIRANSSQTANLTEWQDSSGNVGDFITSEQVRGGNARSSDPSDPATNSHVIWQSDGTGSGADGDILMKITDSGGTTKTATLVDFSAA